MLRKIFGENYLWGFCLKGNADKWNFVTETSLRTLERIIWNSILLNMAVYILFVASALDLINDRALYLLIESLIER